MKKNCCDAGSCTHTTTNPQRDGWHTIPAADEQTLDLCPTCYLCGETIDYNLKYPDPMSQSLDHVVPLIAGGSHTRDNLAYTHLRCNVRKGARSAEDALAA